MKFSPNHKYVPNGLHPQSNKSGPSLSRGKYIKLLVANAYRAISAITDSIADAARLRRCRLVLDANLKEPTVRAFVVSSVLRHDRITATCCDEGCTVNRFEEAQAPQSAGDRCRLLFGLQPVKSCHPTVQGAKGYRRNLSGPEIGCNCPTLRGSGGRNCTIRDAYDSKCECECAPCYINVMYGYSGLQLRCSQSTDDDLERALLIMSLYMLYGSHVIDFTGMRLSILRWTVVQLLNTMQQNGYYAPIPSLSLDAFCLTCSKYGCCCPEPAIIPWLNLKSNCTCGEGVTTCCCSVEVILKATRPFQCDPLGVRYCGSVYSSPSKTVHEHSPSNMLYLAVWTHPP